MPLQIIVGAQWGDEGKGRIVDWYAAQADIVARFNGGDNAGHTVTVGDHIFKLHLIPSGILHPNAVAVLGNGMVINPASLLEEMYSLSKAGVHIYPGRLRISHAAHLITPAHLALDNALETSRGKELIGTTGRGIGPAYTDKAARRSMRVGDLQGADFVERLGEHISESNQTLKMLGAPELDPLPVLESFKTYADALRPYLGDTSVELNEALHRGKRVLAEAAQGTLLDLDHGTYPFVTSSSTTAPGALTGLGLGLQVARDATVIGVCKAFQTRVGSGPFPTEVEGELATRLRGTGENPWDEFGTTTGRPRRVGWLDGVLLRYALRINGLTSLAITKLDVLSGLKQIRVCTAYRAGGKTFSDLPFGPADLSPFEPVYEDLPGWPEEIGACRTWDELPAAAKTYVGRIASLSDVPVQLVSVGPERDQVISLQ